MRATSTLTRTRPSRQSIPWAVPAIMQLWKTWPLTQTGGRHLSGNFRCRLNLERSSCQRTRSIEGAALSLRVGPSTISCGAPRMRAKRGLDVPPRKRRDLAAWAPRAVEPRPPQQCPRRCHLGDGLGAALCDTARPNQLGAGPHPHMLAGAHLSMLPTRFACSPNHLERPG